MEPGHDWSKPPFHEGVYKATFAKPFLVWTLVGFCVFAMTHYIMRQVFSRETLMGDFAFIVAIAIIVGLLVALYGTTFLPVRMTRETISGMNAYGVKQTIGFDDISRVTKPWFTLGLYWVVHSKNSPFKIWLPVCMADPTRFVSDLGQVVSASHPLLRTVADGSRK